MSLDLNAIKERREAAYEWVFAMCKGETRFRMSIPARPDDTDTLLCAALKDSETLAEELADLRVAIADFHLTAPVTLEPISDEEMLKRANRRDEVIARLAQLGKKYAALESPQPDPTTDQARAAIAEQEHGRREQ